MHKQLVTIQRIYKEEKELVIDLFNQYRVFYKQESDSAIADYFITQRLSNNESVIFVALIDERPVGFTQLYPTYSSMRVSKNWILNDLYVEPAFRKGGIGKALIEAAMHYAKGDGATWLALSTAVDNKTAQSLYEAMGFIKKEPDTSFFDYRISFI